MTYIQMIGQAMKPLMKLLILGVALGGAPAFADHGHCPPGLAKKHNGCQPPGHAKKRGYFRIGDRIGDDYIVLRNPGRHGLDPNQTYYRVGDQVYRVNRETREVLDLIGAAAAVLN